MQQENKILSERISLIQRKLADLKIQGLIFLNIINIRYLSGFTGSDGALMICPDRSFLLVDGRYTTQAALETQNIPVIEYKDKIEGIIQTIKDLRLKHIGFEAVSMSVDIHNQLSKRLDDEVLINIGDDLKFLRAYKDETEITLMKKAAAISSAAISALIRNIETGCTERELALQLEIHARRAGADQLAFEAIVASGVNSALPHAQPTDRKIKAGDLIVIDFGVKYKGYCSDETCTFAFGQLTDQQKNAYQIVKQAHDEAIAAIRANVTAGDIDRCARSVLGEKYGQYFPHGTGHGVGLEVHEAPRLAPDSKDVLEAQMVVTVEPGLYIPGLWGIRIEDTVLVKENSCEIFTKMDKQLLIIN
jgi:Xaa-Pro aminopeptidase